MNYRHVYMLIIKHAKSEEKLGLRKKGNGEYYERHHILPKSLFPNWKKRKSNLVLLTAREHFFCHQLLTKIYPCNEMYCALTIFMQFNDKRNIHFTSKEYEELRKYNSIASKSRNSGENNPFYGKHLSDEAKLKMKNSWNSWWSGLSEEEKEKINKSKGRKGHLVSLETKEKLRNKNLGDKNHMFGKHRKDHPEWKSNGLKGDKNPMFGKHLSEEQKEKIGKSSSLRNAGSKNPRARKIYCISNNKIYGCIKDFVLEMNLKEAEVRYKLCKKTYNDIVNIGNIYFRYYN